MRFAYTFGVEHDSVGPACSEAQKHGDWRIRNAERPRRGKDAHASRVDSNFRKFAGHTGAGERGGSALEAGFAAAWFSPARAWVIYLGSGRGAGAAARGDFRGFAGSRGKTRTGRARELGIRTGSWRR